MNKHGVHAVLCLAFLLGTASTHAQSLSVTNNLILWLRPETLSSLDNGDPVTFWSDSSTNQNPGYALSGAAAPTYVTNGINGRPSVQFDGTTDYLALTNKLDPNYSFIPRVRLPSGLTMIAVFRTTNADSVRTFVGNPAQTIIGDGTGAAYSEFGLHGGKAEYNHYVSNWTNYVDGSTPLNNTNVYPGHYIIVTHHSGSGLVNLYADGALQATVNRSYQTTYTAIDRISGGYPGADLYEGLLGEVLVYSGTLSDADRISVQQYLNSRWLDIPEPSIASLLAFASLLVLARRS